VLFAPLRIRLWSRKFREPDLVFMLAEHAARRGNHFWKGADLVMEVVSEDDPDRDVKLKRREYARAGIREYWIVDPRDRTIRVFSLGAAAKSYRLVGNWGSGERAESRLLPELMIDVDQVFGSADV
jgi:Uma2 family endonuclease